MKHLMRTLLTAATIMTGVVAGQAQASIVIASTRVIYPANEREMTVKLTNEGTTPVLAQCWLDTGDLVESPSKIRVPFTLTPPLVRMDAGKSQTLRLTYTKEPLPKDRESLFWLNVLEVPPKAKNAGEGNTLQMAFRTRIKVLFRPQGLPGDADNAPAQTRWTLVRAVDGNGYALKASNPTAYYVNLGKIALAVGGKTIDAGNGYVTPMSSATFPLKDLKAAPGVDAEVAYTAINDYGTGVVGKQAVTVAAVP